MKNLFWISALVVSLPLLAQSTGSGSMGSDASGMGTMGTESTVPHTHTEDGNLGTGSSTVDDRQLQEEVMEDVRTSPESSDATIDPEDIDEE